jgi:hypothetical protein
LPKLNKDRPVLNKKHYKTEKTQKSTKNVYFKTKLEIFSRIKSRLNNIKTKKEISEDLEKLNLAPEELILIEFIDSKITKKKK